MQNVSGIGFPANSKNWMKPIYKVNKAEEKKAFAKKEAAGMVQSGIPYEKTIAYLTGAGYLPEEARQVVTNLETTKNKLIGQKAYKRMFLGLLWIIAGSAITLVSYYRIGFNAGYVLAAVAMLAGSIQFFKGMALRPE